MDEISVIVFDEAHHAVKAHPYAIVRRAGFLTYLIAPSSCSSTTIRFRTRRIVRASSA